LLVEVCVVVVVLVGDERDLRSVGDVDGVWYILGVIVYVCVDTAC